MFDFHYQCANTRRKLFQVKGSHCTIGSARGNDLVLDTRRIAKRHAELREEPDGIHLRDLGSHGGCRVNGERIVDSGPLSLLDQIEVGDVLVALRTTGQTGSTSFSANNDRAPRDGASLPATFKVASQVASQKASQAISQVASQKASQVTSQVTSQVASQKASQVTSQVTSQVASKVNASSRSVHSHSSAASSQVDCLNTVGVDDTAALSPSQDEAQHWQAAKGDAGQDEASSYWCGVIHEQLIEQMDLRRKDVNRMSDDKLREESALIIHEVIESLREQLPAHLDTGILHRNVLNEAVGLGPLELFLADESVSEIMVNNHREIFIEQQGKLVRSPLQFSSDAAVYAVIDRIITPLGRRIDESSPIVDARLKDGSRVNAVIPPLALKGPSLTIRKFPRHRMHFDDLVSSGTLSESMVSFLNVCVEKRCNIIVSGGTGSGKTTLLNVLSGFIPATDRIVTIEDAAELSLSQPNLVSLESRPPNLDKKGEIPIRDLVKNALRMRPDRIVVGECRGGEALDMLQAMNTGHDGSLTTIHANTPRDVLSRLEVLVLMAGMDLPVAAIREQVSSAVDIIIQQQRFTCGSRKITRITEVVGMESGIVQLQDIFKYDQHGVDANHRVAGEFVATGAVPQFYEQLRDFGLTLDLSLFSVNEAMSTQAGLSR